MSIFSKKTSYPLSGLDKGHYNVTYKGIRAIKCPFDYVLYQMLIAEVQPDLIIEIGTNEGGSAVYLADLLSLQNKGEIHTIDLPSNKENPVLLTHPRIKLFKEGFLQYDTGGLAAFNKILVIEDGSHFYQDSLAALHKFAPFVTKDSYYVVEDGIVTELGRAKEFNGGPQKAIAEFLRNDKRFITDRKWCDFFGTNATFNVNGYLKRIS